jgi:hypothetical protein
MFGWGQLNVSYDQGYKPQTDELFEKSRVRVKI